MSKLNHERPILRLIDSMVAERAQLAQLGGSAEPASQDYLAPLFAAPMGLNNLLAFLIEFKELCVLEAANADTSEKIGRVKDACRAFEHTRLRKGKTGATWIAEGLKSKDPEHNAFARILQNYSAA